MAKKTTKKKAVKKAAKKTARAPYVAPREIKLSFHGNAQTRRNKTDSELLFDLISRKLDKKIIKSVKGEKKEKNIYKKYLTVKQVAKKTGKSERTIRSYYNYLKTGKKINKTDRKPPESFLKKIKPLVKQVNKKIKRRKDKLDLTVKSLLTKRPEITVRQDEFMTRDKRKKFEAELKKLGPLYSYTLVRLGVRFYHKHGNIFERYVTFTSVLKTAIEINGQIQDYINSILANYIVKAEILSIYYQIVTRVKDEKKKKGKAKK